jgi:hypothetical protein
VVADFGFGNNPPQPLHGVYHEVSHAVVDYGVVAVDSHQLPETMKVVVGVDSLAVADYAVVAGGTAGVVVVGDLVVDLHKVISGGSGRFGSLTPYWAMWASTRIVYAYESILSPGFG